VMFRRDRACHGRVPKGVDRSPGQHTIAVPLRAARFSARNLRKVKAASRANISPRWTGPSFQQSAERFDEEHARVEPPTGFGGLAALRGIGADHVKFGLQLSDETRGSPTLVGDAGFFLPVVSSNEYGIGTESDRLIPYGGLEIKW
jgi:hypothetical protein